ncbi:MAG: type IVB secretion system protein IcmH/DotU [Legionellales bacterium]|nr:type IVB secretion system protein IcmH/DotU [Legionellales bacterium]
MTAESYSVSLATRLVVPRNHRIPQGYYRSRLFIHSSVTNPLVAAAGPVLSLLERLSISPTLPEVNIIRENIEHELYAFHSRLTGLHYADEFIIIAAYLLTATIDESLGKNYCRIHGEGTEFKAFTPSSHDDIGPQRRFFDIIHHIKERTNQYLDLLELAYYCLIAGFEGEQHLRPDGKQILDNLTEELYQLIQRHRANKPDRLFKEEPPPAPHATNHQSSIVAILLALSTVIALYFTSHLLLEHKAKTVLLGNTMLAHLDY